MKKVNVLIVDDSAFMRRILTDILNKDYRIEVVGTARNGKDCLQKMEMLKPDVITLDVEMPIMDGLEALDHIMKKNPKPVVMVSSLTKEGAESTVKAMSLGAVDFIQKPSGSISLDMENVDSHIIKKVLVASDANVVTCEQPLLHKKVPLPDDYQLKGNLVAIGTSTGGPRALQQVLTSLPGDLPAPIAVVQHMPKGFTKSLADRLDKLCSIQVKEAEHLEKLINGTAYIAPGGYHMHVRQKQNELVIELDESDPVHGHRPSVNRLFSSLSQLKGISTTSVVMTGMGADGAEGLFELKQRAGGTHSIAEAETSCVVYGMPKAIVKSGLADEVRELRDISRSIIESLQIKRG
ncbi:protein-glutamate methylesterase/protein-glutamine glutaminase [Halobacillus litoralis]|uniref:protein-glutamate methylesterase/protein-glutamine glutaminase n=1 Tax=Halobacillus litoralis TaxID=45668 RepID=UPI0024902EF6|nr:chemotaxis response regulator protein-glutamate methylesterase [Halobacillus litoralis]